MRHLAAALLLLAAGAAEGQIVSPVEYAYGRTAGEYVLAAGPHGALLAWDEVNFETGLPWIELARTDANGRLLGNSRILDGDQPGIAGDGESFLLAYTHGTELHAVAIGETQQPVDDLGTQYGRPLVIRTRDGYLLWSISQRLRLDRNGTVLERSNDWAHTRAAATDEALFFYGSYSFPGGRHCGFSRCYDNLPAWYDISWVTEGLSTRNGTERRNWYSPGGTAAAGIGREFVLTWIGPNGIEGLILRDGSPYLPFTIPALGDFGTTPDIASDGRHYLIVFENLGNIHGALLTGDGTVRPFVVSAAFHTETRPKVQAFGEGRFLVTYGREGTILGRVVTMEPGRRRAVR